MSAELAVHVYKHTPVQSVGLTTFLATSKSASGEAVPGTVFEQSGTRIAALTAA
ncbi:hypothetical protein J2W15_002520 [Pseudarthrobacter sulfonivorans]|nr:hypothetical protein [Pseudarthrobacter sulfonivorans]